MGWAPPSAGASRWWPWAHRRRGPRRCSPRSARARLRPRRGGVTHTLAGSLPLFRQLPILMCFAYFCIYTIAVLGLQTFAPTVLNAAFAVPLTVATTALTAYLLGSTAGIVAGGVFATRTERHDRDRQRRAARGRAARAADRHVAARARGAVAAVRAHRIRPRVHGPVARSDRARRDAARRGGARVRLRLFGARSRRNRGADLVRLHARSRRGARRAVRGRRVLHRRDRHRAPGAARGAPARASALP